MSWLHATYRIHAAAHEVDGIAQALALEQSVEVPLQALDGLTLAEDVVGRVLQVAAAGPDTFDVTLALAEATMAGSVAQLVNMLFGNCSLLPHVALQQVRFTPALAARLGGPRFGVAGLRQRLGVHGRPLACAAIKPQGLPVGELAALAERFALGGIDIIKDDHGLADQAYAPFAERVRACQRAVERAERATGRRVLYAPSLVGTPSQLREFVRVVQGEGVGMVLLAPALLGLPVFHEMVQEHLQVPVLAHPSFAGSTRVAPPLLLGTLFRLLGADAVIFPNHGGRFAYSRAVCQGIAQAAKEDLHGLAAALPVPAGGMTVERVPELRAEYGTDCMLLVGGSLLVDGDVSARTRAFTAAVAAQPASAASLAVPAAAEPAA